MADRPAVTCYECNSRIDAVNFGVRQGTIDATEPEWTRKLNKKESWTKLVLRGKLKVFRGRFACNDIGEDILNGSIAQYWILYCAICTRGYVRVWVACNSEVFFFFLFMRMIRYIFVSENSNKRNKLWYWRYIHFYNK